MINLNIKWSDLYLGKYQELRTNNNFIKFYTSQGQSNIV